MTEWLQSGDSQATGPGISDDSGDVEGSEPAATGKPGRAEKLEQKDKIQVRECRIIYKRRSSKSPVSMGQFASMTSLNPRFYIDPNEMLRRQNDEAIAKNAIAKKKTSDPGVLKASATAATESTAVPAAASVKPVSAKSAVDW